MNHERFNQLKVQLEEDLEVLQRHFIASGPIPLSDVRLIASTVLRKWLVEGKIGKIARQLKVKATFPAIDTDTHAAIIDADPLFGYYTAGGIIIEGQPLNSIYVSERERPPNGEMLLPIPTLKDYNLTDFLRRKCIFCDGKWVENQHVIKYMANKAGGVHFDEVRNSIEYETIEKARAFMHFGKEPDRDSELGAFFHLEVSDNTPIPWDCAYVELMSVSQGLLNVRFNGVPLIPLEDKEHDIRWRMQKTVSNIFERFQQ